MLVSNISWEKPTNCDKNFPVASILEENLYYCYTFSQHREWCHDLYEDFYVHLFFARRPLPAERCHLQFWVKMTFWCFLVQIVHFLLLTKLQNWILSTLYVIHEFIKVPFDNSTHFDCIKVTFAYFDCMKVPFAKWNLYALKNYVCFRMVLLHKGAIWQMEPLCTHKIGMLDTLIHVNLEH